MDAVFEFIGNATYGVMAVVALWGAYCVVMVWRRVRQARFRNEAEQNDFFEELEPMFSRGDFAGATQLCEYDRRALPQLAIYAIENRDLGPAKLQRRVVERFQQDFLSDIEHRLSWVSTVTKSSPMLGLFGTVLGMMGAFSNLSQGTKADPAQMANDIFFALFTTAIGLAIAVPLILITASINVQIRKMEDLVSLGLARLLDSLKSPLGRG